MDIRLTRIDSRLIHGQVALNWVKARGVETIICAGDAAAADDLRKQLLLQAAPSGVKANVLSTAKTARVYNNPKYETMPVMLLVESPGEAVKLIDSGIPLTEINLGGLTFKTGAIQLGDAVFARPEDIEALKTLLSRGVKVTIQILPKDTPVNVAEVLSKKGLL